MVTGSRPWRGISPNSALTALRSETLASENVQRYVVMAGKLAAR